MKERVNEGYIIVVGKDPNPSDAIFVSLVDNTRILYDKTSFLAHLVSTDLVSNNKARPPAHMSQT